MKNDLSYSVTKGFKKAVYNDDYLVMHCVEVFIVDSVSRMKHIAVSLFFFKKKETDVCFYDSCL